MAGGVYDLLQKGQLYLAGGYEEMAEVLVTKAYSLDSCSPVVRERLRDVRERLVKRWHFVMLNDLARNSAYSSAIGEAVRQLDKPVVLDIGSGTGILSLMAVRAGASRVFGCDTSRVMIRVSRDVVATNQMQDKVTLLHMLSDDITIPTDLPERVSLVVMEIFDAGLLGEYVIPSLRHAWAELMLTTPTKEGVARVIPRGATVYVCAIECLSIRQRSKLINQMFVSLFEDRGVGVVGSCHMTSGPAHQLVHEPYTTEDLSNVRGCVAYLTSPMATLTFDFTNPEVPLPEAVSVELSIIRSGVVDALGVWYDLHIDHTHSISTSPLSSTKWEQAVFPIEGNLTLSSGRGIIPVEIGCTDTQLVVKAAGTIPPTHSTMLHIERSQLAKLNDTNYTSLLMTAVKACLAAAEGEGEVRIIEVCPQGVPVVGLLSWDENTFLVSCCSHVYATPLQKGTSSSDPVMFLGSVPPTLTDTTWDVAVVTDIVTPQGLLSRETISCLAQLDLTGCSIIPCRIEVVLVGVASPEMRARSCVLGTVPTLGLDIARHINRYQVTHLTDVDLAVLPHLLVTPPIVAHSFELSPPTNVVREIALPCVADGNLVGVAYWFILHLDHHHSVSTGPLGESPQSSAHWHQCVFMTCEDVGVSRGEEITLEFKLIDGYIDIELINK